MTKSLVEQQRAMTGMSKDLLKSQRDMIQLKNQLPNEHQHNIDMYGQLSEATGYKQRPNEPWRALLDGMFKGMAMGEKSEMSKKAKENYDTLEKGTNFVMQNLRAMEQSLADLNKKEQLKETISGYVSPIYSAMMAGADRQKIDDMGRPSFIALQDQGIIPQGAVYLTIDTQSKTLIYNKEDGSKGYVDLIPYVNQETMDMNKQRIEQMGMDARMMSAEASKLNAETGQVNAHTAQERLHLDQKYAPTNAEAKQAYIDNVKFNNDPQQRAQRAALEERGKKNSQYIFELEGKLQAGDIVLNDLEKLKNVINDASVSGSGGWAGIARSFSKVTGNTYSIDQAQMLLQSQLHEMKEIFKGATSDTDVSNFMKTLATLDKNPKASLERLDVLIERAKNKANLYRKQIDLYATDPTSNLFTSTANITRENAIPETSSQTNQMAPTQNLPAKTNRMIMMLTPDGSMKVAVPEDQVLEAINQKYSYPKR